MARDKGKKKCTSVVSPLQHIKKNNPILCREHNNFIVCLNLRNFVNDLKKDFVSFLEIFERLLCFPASFVMSLLFSTTTTKILSISHNYQKPLRACSHNKTALFRFYTI